MTKQTFIIFNSAINLPKAIHSLAVALTIMGLFSAPASADILLTIADDGTNMTMTATGTYDLSGVLPLPPQNDGLGANAVVAPVGGSGDGQFGWESGPVTDTYNIGNFTGIISGIDNAIGADTIVTTTAFHFDMDNDSIRFSSGSPDIGVVNELAVFNNTTVASLGMVAGESISVTWDVGTTGINNSATIVVVGTIPEPSSCLVLAGIGLTAIIRRRR